MKKRTWAAVGAALWLWMGVLAPGVARAEGRAFEFSAGSRSARLLGTGRVPVRGQSGAGRVRAFSDVTVTTDSDYTVPTELWLVPAVLTGAGLLGGVAYCMATGEYDCGDTLKAGLLLGGGLSLLFLGAQLCSDGACGGQECTGDDEPCGEEALRGSRKAGAGLPRGPRALPLRLSPTVGFVNDRAVFGLGGRF